MHAGLFHIIVSAFRTFQYIVSCPATTKYAYSESIWWYWYTISSEISSHAMKRSAAENQPPSSQNSHLKSPKLWVICYHYLCLSFPTSCFNVYNWFLGDIWGVPPQYEHRSWKLGRCQWDSATLYPTRARPSSTQDCGVLMERGATERLLGIEPVGQEFNKPGIYNHVCKLLLGLCNQYDN